MTAHTIIKTGRSGGQGSRGEDQKLTMLITSAGRRMALAAAFRRAAERLGLELTLLCCDLNPGWSAACQVADEAFAMPRVDSPDYADAVLALCRDRGVGIVVPTIDPELLPLARAKSRFAAIGTVVALSDEPVVAVARDKMATAHFLRHAQAPGPLTAPLEEVRDRPDGRWPWPLVIKPRHGSASRSISVVEKWADLPSSNVEPMIAQERLAGAEWTVNMFFDRGGALRAIVPHQRVQVRAGEVEKGIASRHHSLEAIARQIAAGMDGAYGALCFQAMVSRESGPSVFEINARFGGGYPLADHAGASFAQWLLEDAAGMPSTASNGWRPGVTMLRYDAAVFVEPGE